jgi:hypothetical protein
MAKKKARSVRCPTCRSLVLAGGEDFPFCSERCRVIDLGKWASGSYVISSPVTDPEQLENIRERRAQHSADSEDFPPRKH